MESKHDADNYALSQQGAPVPTPVTWRIDPRDPHRTLDVVDAQRTWAELKAWVEWLVKRYCLDHKVVPPCWFHHGALVDELTALWGAWLVAYWPMGSAGDAASWMAMFAATRLRLAEWAGRRGCRPGDHRPDRDADGDDVGDEWETHVNTDLAWRT